MVRSITLVAGPTIEPVTTEEVKALARIDSADEDSLIDDFIEAARTAAEQYTRRSFITQTHRLTLDLPCDRNAWEPGVFDAPINADFGELPRQIKLPKAPLISVSSVRTYDTANTESTFDAANYLVDIAGSRIALNQDENWPTGLRFSAAMAITYVAGYGADAASVPAPIRMAIKMHAAKLYETRGQCGCDAPPGDCQRLLSQYRIMDL